MSGIDIFVILFNELIQLALTYMSTIFVNVHTHIIFCVLMPKKMTAKKKNDQFDEHVNENDEIGHTLIHVREKFQISEVMISKW